MVFLVVSLPWIINKEVDIVRVSKWLCLLILVLHCVLIFSLVRQVLLSFNVPLGDSFSRRSLGIKL